MAATTNTSMWEKFAKNGIHAAVAAISDADSMAMAELYGTHNYAPLQVNIVRGEGAKVWDGDGNEYIDCIGAYSAVASGHLSPFIVQTIKEQLDQVAVISRAYYSPEVALFLKTLADFSGLDKVCPMNSGAEAVETCIKLARKWGYTKKGVELDKAEIIVTENNFHGRTTTIVGFSTEETYKKLFGPHTPGFKVVPFGDAEALAAAITPNTVGFLAEPVQAEGGILMPPDGYYTKVREICDANNVLLIWDEIQSGFYRTGYRFAWQYEPNAQPDLMAVGKPLGGGVLPVSAAIGKNHVMEVFQPGDHGSTFGGNPLGAVVGIAAMTEMETLQFGKNSTELGNLAMETIRSWNLPHVKEVRGRGLLIGIETLPTVDGKLLSKAFMKAGILTKQTRKYTFRLTPPITIGEEVLKEALQRIHTALLSVAP